MEQDQVYTAIAGLLLGCVLATVAHVAFAVARAVRERRVQLLALPWFVAAEVVVALCLWGLFTLPWWFAADDEYPENGWNIARGLAFVLALFLALATLAALATFRRPRPESANTRGQTGVIDVAS